MIARLGALVSVVAVAAAAAPTWNGHVPRGCARPFQKGPGTVVVNATPIPVAEGQTILVCNGRPR